MTGPRPSPPHVRLRGVELIRDGVSILCGIDWDVAPGEHWAILGPNGSGKTTLMRIVAGWLFPSRGQVEVLGGRFGRCAMIRVRQQVGWVSSALEGMLRPRLQALGVVLSGRRAALGIVEEPTAAELKAALRQLDALGCGGLAQRPFCLLSQGEQMRVMIARALLGRPRLLVLDEPCAGLDPPAREVLLAHLNRLTASPAAPTLLYVTHHLEEIVPAIGRVLILRGGRVVAAGDKAAVLRDEVLAAAFDCPVRVRRHDSRYQAVFSPDTAPRPEEE
ncbi:MAG: ATP-binding cassette domain-containing protein [Kiritimatiellaeota bacterium]|nr:ATP-binding cassette domain-containing protein [Kiritimatiellota bacterium]